MSIKGPAPIRGMNYHITAIAESKVAGITAGLKEGHSKGGQFGILNRRFEGMLGVVAMLVVFMAGNAEIKVIASCARNKVLYGQVCKL